MILDLWGVPFHAMVVFGLVPDLLIKSTSAYCDWELVGIGQTRVIQIKTPVGTETRVLKKSRFLSISSETT